jgi:hypothetical protein
LEDTLSGLAFVKQRRSTLFARLALAFSIMICAAVFVFAQTGRMSPYQNESDGESAGGNWLVFHAVDKMTGAKKDRFLLVADNYFREDPNYKPRVQLFCSDGKLTLADFNPGVRLGGPDHPGFWGQPKMEVMVRIDDYHTHHGWNWVRGHFLSMDKGTVRGLIGAQTFNVEVRTKSGPQIAEFSPAGLDLQEVRQSCGLTPKKPKD